MVAIKDASQSRSALSQSVFRNFLDHPAFPAEDYWLALQQHCRQQGMPTIFHSLAGR